MDLGLNSTQVVVVGLAGQWTKRGAAVVGIIIRDDDRAGGRVPVRIAIVGQGLGLRRSVHNPQKECCEFIRIGNRRIGECQAIDYLSMYEFG